MEGATFPPREEKLKRREICLVEGCKSDSDKNFVVSFHKLPRVGERVVYVKNYFGVLEKQDKLLAWKQALQIKSESSKGKICSLHFNKEDYILPDEISKRKLLRPMAVPSCNLPKKKHDERLQRNKKRHLEIKSEIKEESILDINEVVDLPGVSKIDFETSEFHNINHSMAINDPEAFNDSTLAGNFIEVKVEICEPTEDLGIQYERNPFANDIGVQVKSEDLSFEFSNLIQNERDLSTITGINSFKVLDCIVELVKEKARGLVVNRTIKIDLYQRIIMTYMKLKQNCSFSLLAVLFRCITPQNCRLVFNDTVELLYESLNPIITWPSKKEILKNMPICFKDFEDVRVVIECTEVFIQNSKNLCCQIKKSQIGKIMTGVAPDGSIIYVSKVWDGKTSDIHIFENSDIINLLQSGDAVMVNQGFKIEEICVKNNWKFICPPFMEQENQFKKDESIIINKISRARIHVDRSNQRIKMFKILGETMPVSLVSELEKIFKIICATINLCSPILRDNKFMEQL